MTRPGDAGSGPPMSKSIGPDQLDVSVIAPVMDEAASLPLMYEQLVSSLQGFSFELIFVDDGSEDGSLEELTEEARKDRRVRILRFRRHFGKAAALAAGFAEARGLSVVTIDSDLQNDPQDIPLLLSRLREGFDLVSGWRTQRKDPWTRRIPSRIYNWATRRMSGLRLHDFNCGLKAYSEKCAREMALACYGELHRYLPFLAHARGFKVTEVPVRHYRRPNGRSRYGVERLPRAFFDLLTATFLCRYARRPMHGFGSIGLSLLIPGVGLLAFIGAARLVTGTPAGGGFPLLLLLGGLLALSGLQFMIAGLIAEMVTSGRDNSVPYVPVAALQEATPVEDLSLPAKAGGIAATAPKGGGEARIVLVGPGPGSRGGISQFNTHLAEALRDDAEVTLLGFRRLYPVWTRPGRDEHDGGARLSNLPGEPVLVAWRPWTWRSAARRIRELRPNVVVLQWWHPAFSFCFRYLARQGRRQGARIVFVCHNARPHERWPGITRLTRRVLRSADAVLTPSSSTEKDVASVVRGVRTRVLAHPAFRFPPASGAARERWQARIGPRGPVILFFGYVRAYKGLADLMEAMLSVRRRLPGAVLVVAGPFLEPSARYRRRAADLGLSDAVRFFEGYVPNEEVSSLFDLADVVVLPYRSATQSGVLPLAASWGKRVVTTRVGGLPESAGHGAVLVRPRDPTGLAEGILHALASAPPSAVPDGWGAWRDALLEEARDPARLGSGRGHGLDETETDASGLRHGHPPGIAMAEEEVAATREDGEGTG
jgi:glycosyltransferase involved in cell wall biosynthesis